MKRSVKSPLLFRDLRALIDRDLPFPTALNKDIEPSILACDVLTLVGSWTLISDIVEDSSFNVPDLTSDKNSDLFCMAPSGPMPR
jgi:hypothetical protein